MTAATRLEISRWLDKLYEDDNLTHMIVFCDEFDWSDYPVYVKKSENVAEVEEEHRNSMTRTMEVYSRNHSKEEQLAEHRAFYRD